LTVSNLHVDRVTEAVRHSELTQRTLRERHILLSDDHQMIVQRTTPSARTTPMAILRFYAPEILDGHDSASATLCEPVATAQVSEKVILPLSVAGVPLGYIETSITTRARLTSPTGAITWSVIGTHAVRAARRSEREK
jgi:hypothetical protein